MTSLYFLGPRANGAPGLETVRDSPHVVSYEPGMAPSPVGQLNVSPASLVSSSVPAPRAEPNHGEKMRPVMARCSFPD